MGYALLPFFPRDDGLDMTKEELIAPIFLGVMVNFLLWGMQITQSYVYYKSYRTTDPAWIKTSVGLLFICDAIQSVVTSQQGWRFTVQGWGDKGGILQSPSWGLFSLPLTDAIITSIVHVFYAQRIIILLKPPYNFFCTAIVIVLSGLQLTGGVGFSAVPFALNSDLSDFSHNKIWACLWLISATATGIIITALLSWKLPKIQIGYKSADDMIARIMRGTVETGMATAVVQLATLIVFLIWTSRPYFIFFVSILSKVYSNSMLALLNSRQTRTPAVKWDPVQQRQVGNIRIHTTQTVDIADDDELVKTSSKHRNDPFH